MTNLARRRLLCLVVAGLFAIAPARADDGPRVTVETLLHKMVDLSWLAQPPAGGERSVLFSSYDRASKLEAGKLVEPFANNDRGHYLRVEGEGDRREWVLAESKGPGYVSRIWSANPDGELRIYIDGTDKPALAEPFANITESSIAPSFGLPFSHAASRGHNLYFPFPFARSIKITTTKGDQYYQVNVTTLPEGTQVESYSPEVRARAAGTIASTGLALLNSRSAEELSALMASQPFTLKPGQSIEIVPTRNPGDRPGVITDLACMVSTTWRDDDSLHEALARTLLTITFDDAATPQVAAPLGDFFGTGPGARDCQMYTTSAGTHLVVQTWFHAFSRWCMPYRRSARIVLKNQSTHEARIAIRANVHEDPAAARMLTFHARWRSDEDLQTKKAEGTLDWPALRVKGGPGRFVGLLCNVYNPTSAWWGEGDEKIYVDGEKFPSTFGTGTEDYFGYAWCDPHTFANPFHAQTQCDGPGNKGNTSNVRHQILDSVPFQESLDFDLEVWHWEAVKMQYQTLAYFYAAPEATVEPGVPDLSTRTVHPKPPVKHEPGAIEAEGLKIRGKTAGDVPIQEMTPFGDAWSGEQQLLWVVREPGARLDLELPVDKDGTYALWGGFTKAPDYAMVQVALDGKDLGRPIDLYAPEVVHSGATALGVLSLEAGTHVLSLTIAGKNPKSTSYLVGLDWLKLAPTQTILPAPEQSRR